MSKPMSSRVPSGKLTEAARHDFGRLADDFAPAVAAERPADPRVEQPQVVVDLGRRADGRSRVADAVLLADGYRRTDPFDGVDVRLLHPFEELAGVGRQRLDVPALPFGIDRVEGQRRLARSADARHHDERARPAASGRRSSGCGCGRRGRRSVPGAIRWLPSTVRLSAKPEQSMVAQANRAFNLGGDAGQPHFHRCAILWSFNGDVCAVGAKRTQASGPASQRAPRPSTKEGAVSVRLFIGNLPYAATESRFAGASVERRRTRPDRASCRSGNRPSTGFRVRRLCGSRGR